MSFVQHRRSFRTIFPAGSLALLVLLLAFAHAPAAQAGPKCTIKGTKGPDRLFGKKGRDVICGLGGNDRLVGKGGNDILIGGKGDDKLNGMTGNDELLGGPGDDNLVGADGNDRLMGQPQDDALFGGDGDDYLDGGSGTNRIFGGSGENRCLSNAADTLAGTCDNKGPEITEFSLDRTEVNTSDAGQSIAVRARIKDDLGGAKSTIFIRAVNSKNQDMIGLLNRESGDAFDGVYTGGFYLPRYTPKGHWNIELQLSDAKANSTYYGTNELASLGFPTGFDQVGPGDEQGPVIQDFTMSRTTVDTSTGVQPIDIHIHLTDDLSGIADVRLSISRPGFAEAQEALLLRVSGDGHDAVYEGQLKMARYSAQGPWIVNVGARDNAGNYQSQTKADFASRGWPTQINQTGPGDTTPPHIAGFSVSPRTIDTTGGPQTVNFQIEIADDLAGLYDSDFWPDFGPSFNVQVNGYESGVQLDTHYVSGPSTDKTYAGSLTLPQGSINGSWTVSGVLADNTNNISYFNEASLNKIGLSSAFHNGP